MATKEEAREKLLKALPYIRHGVDEAQKEGKVFLGILVMKPDGTGQIKVKFEAGTFFEDLATALDAPPQTEDDTLNGKALQLLDQFGLRKEK